MTIPTNLATLAAQLRTLSEQDRNVLLSLPASTATIDSAPEDVSLQSPQTPAHQRSQTNTDFFEALTMAPSRRPQLAITDHFRGVSSQRTTPRNMYSRRATITLLTCLDTKHKRYQGCTIIINNIRHHGSGR
jgi:hypothetical protein